MWKYFTEMNTRRYIDVLDKFMHSYNHTFHRSIQTEPISVTLENQGKVWQTLYGQTSLDRQEQTRLDRLEVGDTVRISRDKMKFEKGYEQSWTREIFTIHQILPRIPVVYKLKDLAGEVVQGTFYKQELQKISNSGYYPVEKVLKTRTRNGKTELFVKFLGYPEKFNAWVEDFKAL
ncbi:hypothetical protein RF55_16787 [Lasius niger]|uniref:Chromo domain-containing protein n=1 Tax=Lasius niger TaxID=67767 RepID=A0A0J7K3Q6_LASNI|nr:hypothetical protein RF55_16787 [Lasius niger]